jgi:hypothetical protein
MMDCAEVRGLLPEHALGTLEPSLRARVDAHLAWCAGCRKEAGELAEGAAALALDLPSPDPPAGLEERVRAAVRRRSGGPRRRAGIAAAVLAAVVASATVGWGLAVAGRPEATEPATARDAMATLEGVREFLLEVGGAGTLESVRLRAVRSGAAGGGATMYSSAGEAEDSVVVVVGGLPAERGPYTVSLRSSGTQLLVGTLEELSSGQWALGREFFRDLSGFDHLVVEDAAGHRVLAGSFLG